MPEWQAVLPWPPSVNHYYTVVRGRKILSAEGRTYHATVSALCARNRPAQPLSGRVGYEVLASPPDRRKRDLSNLVKALEDSLTYAGIWVDDEQVDDFRFRRGPIVPGGSVAVSVWLI